MTRKASVLEHPMLSRKKQSEGLLNAIEITEQMLNIVNQGETQGLEKLEIERQGCLDGCLSIPVQKEDFKYFSDALKALLLLNEELMELMYQLPEFSDQKNSSEPIFGDIHLPGSSIDN